MSIKVKGHTPKKISRPTSPIFDPEQERRNNFLKGLGIQVALLEGVAIQHEGQDLHGSDGKPKVRQWWRKTCTGYETDVKIEDKSLVTEGYTYKFPDKERLRGFYKDVEKQCKNGDFDEDFEEALRRKRAIQL